MIAAIACLPSIYSSNKQGCIVDLLYSMIGITMEMKRSKLVVETEIYEKKVATFDGGRWVSQ
jgi:hypothetical protein